MNKIIFIFIFIFIFSQTLNAETMGGRSITTTQDGVKKTYLYNLEIPDSLAKKQPDFNPSTNISMSLEKAIHRAEVSYLKSGNSKHYKIRSISLRAFRSNPKSWYYDIFIGSTRVAVLTSGLVIFEKKITRN